MNKRNRIVLRKIIEESAALAKLLHDIDEQTFLANDEKMRATCMTIINIGELAKNLDEGFRKSYAHIPWKDMVGLRDVSAHGYFTLRMPDIWVFATEEFPTYAMQIKEILESEEKTNRSGAPT